MRNKSKKLIAIMAALMIAGSSVAATATTAFAISVGQESAVTVTVAGETGWDLNNTAGNYVLYAATYDIGLSVEGTYQFGKAVEPLKDKDIYVKLVKSGSDKGYVKLDPKTTTIKYDNNINATTGTNTKATATITVNQEATSSDGKTVKIVGTIVKEFDIGRANFDDTFLAKPVKAVWTGGKISVNKADLQLNQRLTSVDGTTVYYEPIDSSLYKIKSIDTDAKIKEENGVITFTPATGSKPGDTLNVDYAAGETVKNNITDGTATGAIVLQKADWKNAIVTVKNQTTLSATDVVVTLNGNKLTVDTNTADNAIFESNGAFKVTGVEWEDATTKTVAKVTIKPNPAYFTTSDKEVYYANVTTDIASKIQATSVAFVDGVNPTYTYTGEEIKPAVTLKTVPGVTLVEGVDYEVVYANNKENGTGTAKVKGIGAYAGEVAVGNFKIAKKNLADCTVEATDVTYETTAPTKIDELAKAVTVKNGDKVLEYGKDYKLALNSAIKDGANTLKVLPVIVAENVYANTNYVGVNTVTVNVKKVVDLSTAEIATIANVAYTGAEAKPTLSVKLGDKELVEGTDYTVAYTNNTEVGMATATITGIGSYKGTAARNFVIVPEKVTGLKAIKKTTTTLKLQFNAVTGADGYKIYDAETGKALASVSTQDGASVLKKTIKGLKAGETRKYKVRAYVNVNGTKRYAAYSDIYTKATATK